MNPEKYGIKPNALLDQSFMIDRNMIKRIVKTSEIRPKETVLEIGAGMGSLTKELAKTGANIIAIEIDKRFEPVLKQTGVKVIIGNALDIIKTLHFDKIVSNIPYGISEPLMQELVRIKFDQAFLSVPKKFAYRLLKREGIGLLAQAFFDIKILFDIPKKAFKPEPKTNNVFIRIEPRTEDYYRNNIEDFILKEIVSQKTKKLWNALMEAIINSEKLFGKSMTKKQSKERIKSLNLNNKLLEQKTNSIISLKTLVDIVKNIKSEK